MKTCTKCGVEKSFQEFYFRQDQGRYRSECRACSRGAEKPRRHVVRSDEPATWIGRKFVRWTVTTEPRIEDCERRVDVVCDCGTRRTVACYKLRSRGSRSCGCLAREMASGRATRRGRGTRLPEEFRAERMGDRCDYCGDMPWRRLTAALVPGDCRGCGAAYEAQEAVTIWEILARPTEDRRTLL